MGKNRNKVDSYIEKAVEVYAENEVTEWAILTVGVIVLSVFVVGVIIGVTR